jgi:hypothetical protein
MPEGGDGVTAVVVSVQACGALPETGITKTSDRCKGASTWMAFDSHATLRFSSGQPSGRCINLDIIRLHRLQQFFRLTVLHRVKVPYWSCGLRCLHKWNTLVNYLRPHQNVPKLQKIETHTSALAVVKVA